jgi:hypothetical protein
MKLSTLPSGLLLAMGMTMTFAAPAQVVDEGNGAGKQNTATDVNDAGIVIGNALSSANRVTAFVVPTAGTEVPLATLANDACAAGEINNNGSSSQILGSCKDGNGVSQAVTWIANTPTTAPQQLQPIGGLLGLGADVQTAASAQNDNGDVVGVSISNNGTARPVYWAAGTTTPNLLNVGLLDLANTNCTPADISNPIASNGSQPAAVGECPSDGRGTGKPAAVIWPNLTTSATTLPLPDDAEYCSADEIDTAGYVLGSCSYADDLYRTVRWSYPWTDAPIVLQTISTTANAHNSDADMNANGEIAGNYLDADGFEHAFYWNPASGTDAVGIAALPGGATESASAIGNNGEVIGTSETSNGDVNAFHSLRGAVPTDDVPLPNGSNDGLTSISPSGQHAAGKSEGNWHVVHAIEEELPPGATPRPRTPR